MELANTLLVDLEDELDRTGSVISQVCRRLGYFSLTNERFYRPNASELKVFKVPKPEAFPLGLNGDLDPRFRKNYNHFYDEYLDNVLFGISDVIMNSNGIVVPYSNGVQVKTDVVCLMEVLQTIMCTPFKRREDWLVLAIRYRGTLYLCLENPGEQPWSEEQKKRSSMEAMLKHQLYSGSNTTRPEECSEFNYILNSRLNNLSLVYSAPMNGVEPPSRLKLDIKNLSPDKILELNFYECKLVRGRRQLNELYSSEEALMWWTEGHLKGVKNFLLALADANDRVQQLQPVSCEQMRRQYQATWSGDHCIRFLSHFLTQIQGLMRNDDCGTIYEFRYVAKEQGVFWSKSSGERLSFLPEWYRNIVEDYY